MAEMSFLKWPEYGRDMLLLLLQYVERLPLTKLVPLDLILRILPET